MADVKHTTKPAMLLKWADEQNPNPMWIGARNVDVTEYETAALMAQAEAPQFLHMNLRGQLLHTARSMWAYRALAKLRGEYWPADDVTGIERADGVTAAMAARGA